LRAVRVVLRAGAGPGPLAQPTGSRSHSAPSRAWLLTNADITALVNRLEAGILWWLAIANLVIVGRPFPFGHGALSLAISWKDCPDDLVGLILPLANQSCAGFELRLSCDAGDATCGF